jgi:hypothetical protein
MHNRLVSRKKIFGHHALTTLVGKSRSVFDDKASVRPNAGGCLGHQRRPDGEATPQGGVAVRRRAFDQHC